MEALCKINICNTASTFQLVQCLIYKNKVILFWKNVFGDRIIEETLLHEILFKSRGGV